MEGKIKVPAQRIFRTFIQNHPDWIFVYGQDWFNKGCLGMAWQFGGEPNTYPVPTLYKLCNSSTDKFFRDEHFYDNKQKIDERLDAIPLNTGRPIICPPKIGCGHSRMRELAPQTYAYLRARLDSIQYIDIDWDWSR